MAQVVPTSESLEEVLALVAQARAGLRNLAAEATNQADYRADREGRDRIDMYAKAISQALKTSEARLAEWLTIVEALNRRGGQFSIVKSLDDRIAELSALRDRLKQE